MSMVHNVSGCFPGTVAPDEICDWPSEWNRKWALQLDSEFLAYTPKHWLKFEPPSCGVHFFLATLYLLILVPGFLGNLIIIYLFVRIKTLRSPSNVISINLAVADMLMNVQIPAFVYNSAHCGPSTGITGCKIYGFIGGLSGTAAIVSITVMSLERLLVIVFPLKAKLVLTKRKSWGVAGFIWCYSLAFALPPLVGMVNNYVPEGFLTSCTFDYLSKEDASRLYILTFCVGAWLLPMIIITLSYSGVVATVRRSAKSFAGKGPGAESHSRRSVRMKNRSELKLARVAFTLVLVWTVAWTPYAIVALLGIFTDPSVLTPFSSMFPALFAKLASTVDPILYAFSHPGYKKEFRRSIWGKLFYVGSAGAGSYHSSTMSSSSARGTSLKSLRSVRTSTRNKPNVADETIV